MKYAVAVLLLLPMFFLGGKYGELPNVIYKAPEDDPNLVQWRKKDFSQVGDSIVTASVVSSSSEEIFVYIDYINFSIGENEIATAGANIKDRNSISAWSYSPSFIGRGRGFMVLKSSLYMSGDVACSDKIEIIFYRRDGIVYFKQEIDFKKTWIRQGGQSLYGKLREVFSLCPE